MHRLFICLLTGLMVVFLPQNLWAQGPDGPPHPDAQPARPNPETLFNRLDLNHDGAITQDELPPNMPELLKQLLLSTDRNGDGKITLDELTKAIHQRRPGPRDQINRFDRHFGGPEGGPPQMAGPPFERPQWRNRPMAGPPTDGPDRRSWTGVDRQSWAGPGYGSPHGPPWAQPAVWENYHQGPPAYPGQYHGWDFPPPRHGPPMYTLAHRGPFPGWEYPEHRPGPRLHQTQYGRPWSDDYQRPQHPRFDLKDIFIRLDKNDNGQLSFEEFSQGIRHLLRAMGPGQGPQGARPPQGFYGGGPFGPPPHSGMANYWDPQSWGIREKISERFKSLDKNQDGKLSKDEAPPWLQKNFDRIDANNDSAIEPRELYRALASLRQRLDAQKPPKPQADKSTGKSLEQTPQQDKTE